MAQVNFMARESSVRAQSGPESVYLGVTWIALSGLGIYELWKPLCSQKQNGSLGTLLPTFDFYQIDSTPRGYEQSGPSSSGLEPEWVLSSAVPPWEHSGAKMPREEIQLCHLIASGKLLNCCLSSCKVGRPSSCSQGKTLWGLGEVPNEVRCPELLWSCSVIRWIPGRCKANRTTLRKGCVVQAIAGENYASRSYMTRIYIYSRLSLWLTWGDVNLTPNIKHIKRTWR